MSDKHEPMYVPGELLVKLGSELLIQIKPSIPDKGSSTGATGFGIASIDQALRRFGVRAIFRLDNGIFLIRFPPETDLSEVKATLKSVRYVEDMDFNYLARTMG